MQEKSSLTLVLATRFIGIKLKAQATKMKINKTKQLLCRKRNNQQNEKATKKYL